MSIASSFFSLFEDWLAETCKKITEDWDTIVLSFNRLMYICIYISVCACVCVSRMYSTKCT